MCFATFSDNYPNILWYTLYFDILLSTPKLYHLSSNSQTRKNIPKIDEHLTNYYQLNDEGRNEVDQFIKAQLMLKKRSGESRRY